MGRAGYGDTLLLHPCHSPLGDSEDLAVPCYSSAWQGHGGPGDACLAPAPNPLPPLQDLSSPSQYDTGVALTGLSCFVTPDLARDLANDIMTLVSVPLLCEGIWKSRARGGPRLSVTQDPPGVRQWAGVPGGSRGTHSAASPPSASFSHFSFISFETVLFGGGVGVAGGRGLAEDAQPRGQAHDLSGTVLLKLK